MRGVGGDGVDDIQDEKQEVSFDFFGRYACGQSEFVWSMNDEKFFTESVVVSSVGGCLSGD